MIYYNIFFFLTIFSLMEVYNLNKKIKFVFYYSFMIFLITFTGFRYNIGYDFEAYQIVFDNFTILTFVVSEMELGFLSLIWIIKEFTNNFNILLLLVAAISLSIKFKIIKEYSPYVFLSLLLYFAQEFLARDFSNIRQGLAIAITAYSVKYIYERKLKSFLTFILIAIMFHTTAIIFSILYIFANKKISKLFLYFTVFLALSIGQLLNTENIVNLLSLFNNEYLLNKLIDYSSKIDYSSSLGITPGLIQRIFIFFIFVYFEKILASETKYYYLLRNISWIGLIIFLFFNSFEILAARGSYYFRFFDIVIIVYLIKIVKDQNIRVIILFIISLYAFQGLFRELTRHGVYSPYVTNLF